MKRMDDITILACLEMCEGEVKQGELVLKIRSEEELGFQEFLDMVDNKFKDMLVDLAARKLINRRYKLSSYKHSLTEQGETLLKRELGR